MVSGVSFVEQTEAAREVLTADECVHLDELHKEIAAESPPALAADPPAARNKFYDLVNVTTAERRLESFTK